MCVFYLLSVCVGYRLRSLSHGGIEYRSHNGEFSVMSRSRSQGTEVTIVTGAFVAFVGLYNNTILAMQNI